MGKENIESSMLCAGGEGSGTNKVNLMIAFSKDWNFGTKKYTRNLHIFVRATVGGPSQLMRMASTLWLVSLVMGYQRFLK